MRLLISLTDIIVLIKGISNKQSELRTSDTTKAAWFRHTTSSSHLILWIRPAPEARIKAQPQHPHRGVSAQHTWEWWRDRSLSCFCWVRFWPRSPSPGCTPTSCSAGWAPETGCSGSRAPAAGRPSTWCSSTGPCWPRTGPRPSAWAGPGRRRTRLCTTPTPSPASLLRVRMKKNYSFFEWSLVWCIFDFMRGHQIFELSCVFFLINLRKWTFNIW